VRFSNHNGCGVWLQAGDDLYQRGPKRFKKSPFDVITGDWAGGWRWKLGGFVGEMHLVWLIYG
jgi:hypothetical protein